MPRVLIISPCFAPSSYPPALRTRLFALHLSSFGWEPVVLTVDPKYIEGIKDPLLERSTLSRLEVVRTKAVPYQLTRRFGVGELGLRAFWHQYQAAKKIILQKKIDLVFISGPPWTTFMIGALLKRKYGIPYVLDYIDPWVNLKNIKRNLFKKRFWADKLAEILDPISLRHASGVTAVSRGILDLLLDQYPFLHKKSMKDLPYGYHREDFDFLKNLSLPNNYFNLKDGYFHISYVGAVWKEAYGTLKSVFSALYKIKKEFPDKFSRMKWHFIGTSYGMQAKPQVLPIAEECGVREAVQESVSRVSYFQALHLLQQSDALFAFGSNDPSYTSSKIFPCVLAQKPILAVYHRESSVLQILKDAGVGKVVSFFDEDTVEGRIDELKMAILEFLSGTPPPTVVNWEGFSKYSAASMTEELVTIFERTARLVGKDE